jgi:hypothetical protein
MECTYICGIRNDDDEFPKNDMDAQNEIFIIETLNINHLQQNNNIITSNMPESAKITNTELVQKIKQNDFNKLKKIKKINKKIDK